MLKKLTTFWAKNLIYGLLLSLLLQVFLSLQVFVLVGLEFHSNSNIVLLNSYITTTTRTTTITTKTATTATAFVINNNFNYYQQHKQKQHYIVHYQYKYFQQNNNPTIRRNNNIATIHQRQVKLSLYKTNNYDYQTKYDNLLLCTFHVQQQQQQQQRQILQQMKQHQQKPLFLLLSSSREGVDAERQDGKTTTARFNDDSIVEDYSSTIQYENPEQQQQQQQIQEQNQQQYTNNNYYHHTAIRTNNITTSIDFYCTLFGYTIECKFRAGPARAVWLMKKESNQNSNENRLQQRIELIEVPSYMLQQQQQNQQQQLDRAIDVFQFPTMLGYNHIAFDVTNSTYQDNENNNTTKLITSLQHYITLLNKTSIEKYNKTIRVALLPKQQLIGQYVYEIAFIYDPNNCIIEFLYYQNTITTQSISSGWDPIILLDDTSLTTANSSSGSSSSSSNYSSTNLLINNSS